MNRAHQYKCCVCGELFNEVNTLEAHLSNSHVFYLAYECEICVNALFPSDHSLRQHYLTVHRKRCFNVKYKVTPELEQRRELLNQMMAKSVGEDGLDSVIYQSNSNQRLLQSCTAKLLQENIASTSHFLSKLKSEIYTENQDQTLAHYSNERSNNDQATSANNIEFSPKRYSTPDLEGSFGKETNKKNSMDLDESNNVLDITSEAMKYPGMRKFKTLKEVGRESFNPNNSSNQLGMLDSSKVVECAECKRKVGKYRNSMLIHASKHHCELPIFECVGEGCTKKWYSLSARTREHIETKHGGDFTLLKDNRPQLMPQLKSLTLRLFPY